MKKVCWKLVESKAEATSGTSKSDNSFMFTSGTPRDQFTCQIDKHGSMRVVNMPHLKWNGKKFRWSSPEPPPLVEVEITMMPGTYAIFGHPPRKPITPRAHPILAFADTRAQTCSAGPEIQKLLGYPDGYLVSTTHRIRGITNDRLRVKGVLFLCIKVGDEGNMAGCVRVRQHSWFLPITNSVKGLRPTTIQFLNIIVTEQLITNGERNGPVWMPSQSAHPNKAQKNSIRTHPSQQKQAATVATGILQVQRI